ncbi:hypothetical protein N499_0994B, partial [Wolbachia pipientis wVitA]
PFQCQALE